MSINLQDTRLFSLSFLFCFDLFCDWSSSPLCVYGHHHDYLWWCFCCLCVCVVRLIWKFWKKKGITPLMRACEKGDLKMITLLIKNGASLKSLAAEVFFSFFFSKKDSIFLGGENFGDWLLFVFLKDGSDPLILACEFGNLEIVQFLFEKGSSLQSLVNHFSFFSFFISTHTRNWMLDLYVLQVKMGNLIWLNFWFLKIVQSMEFTLNLYFLFFFFFFKLFESSFLFVFFKSFLTPV